MNKMNKINIIHVLFLMITGLIAIYIIIMIYHSQKEFITNIVKDNVNRSQFIHDDDKISLNEVRKKKILIICGHPR